MKDFVEERLFPKATRNISPPPHEVIGLVSPFRAGDSLDENMGRLAGWLQKDHDFFKEAVYCEDNGNVSVILIYGVHMGLFSKLETRLQDVAVSTGQRGFIIAAPNQALFCDVMTTPRLNKVLALYNRTQARIEEYANEIVPGFAISGYFPRQHLYVTAKLREHGL